MTAEAIRRLELLYERHLKETNTPFFVHDLNPADQNLFAVALIGSWLPIPNDEVPWWLTHFDDIVLVGGEIRDERGDLWFGLLVCQPGSSNQAPSVQFGSAGFRYRPAAK